LQKALEHDASDSASRLQLARALFVKGQHEAAIEEGLILLSKKTAPFKRAPPDCF
jgi:thioredoxin-like negative regulator of GroEL